MEAYNPRSGSGLSALLTFLFLLAVYFGWDKIVAAMDYFLRGCAAIK